MATKKKRDYKHNVKEDGSWTHEGAFKDKPCAVCDTLFTPRSGIHKFCSESRKGKWKYVSGKVSTESQYREISGNWDRYVSRLMYYNGRKRDKLSRDIILNKLKEQEYKCALSGIPMTCLLEKGKSFPTNVSIDRIEAGGAYTEDNIQLVCRALNAWRSDTPVEDFVDWCRAVVKHHEGK